MLIRRVAALGALGPVFVALVLTAGCQNNKKSDPAAKGPGGDSKQAPPVAQSVEPAFKGTAVDFVAEFKKDTNAANQKYYDKPVEVEGEIFFLQFNKEGPQIYLKGGEGSDRIVCDLKEADFYKKAVTGQKVKVRGTVSSAIPWMKEVEIVSGGPTALIETTAAKLSEENAKDRDAFQAKYKDKVILFTGELADVKMSPTSAAQATIKGAGKGVIECGFGDFHPDAFKGVPAGSTVTIVGTLGSSNADTVFFGKCGLVGKGK